MKTICFRQLVTIAAFLSVTSPCVYAQNESADESLKVVTGGTFGKPKILPSLNSLGVAQTSIYFKTATTREILENERGAFGGRKSGGGSVAGRITAYLETTDGELTEADFQELTDQFYTYFQSKLTANGIKPVEWNTISNTDFYKNESIDLEDLRKDMEQMKKKGQIYTLVNANKGNSLYKYSITGGMNLGFAFGKIKKASNFAKDVAAPVIFMHLVVDFADIWLDGDVRTGTKTEETSFYTKITTSKNWKMDAKVGADIKVSTVGTSMLWDEKSRSESLVVAKDIHSLMPFATSVSQDPNKEVLRKKDNIFAKDFNMKPMVVSTTKAQYKAAAKKALENYADFFIAKAQGSKK